MDLLIPDDEGDATTASKAAGFHLTRGRTFVLNLVGFLLVCATFLCGNQYLDIYYDHYHLDAGLFPKSTTDYFVYGGYAIYRTTARIFGDGRHSNLPSLLGVAFVVATGMAAYVYVLLLSFSLIEKCGRAVSRRLPVVSRLGKSASRLRDHKQTQAVAVAALGSLGGFALLLLICLSIVIYVSIPTLIASSAARLQFQEEQNRFASDCQKVLLNAGDVCMEVRDAKQQFIARGFVIASAPGYIALDERNRVQFVSLQDRALTEFVP